MTADSSDISSTPPIKLMIVDDSAVIRGFLIKALGTCKDIEIIHIATNGVEAINQLTKKKCDIIILDVEMPVMDGLTAIP